MISIVTFFIAQLYSIVQVFRGAPYFAFTGYVLVYFMYHPERWWFHNVPQLSYSFFMSSLILFAAFIYRKNITQTNPFHIPMFKWLAALVAVYCFTSFWAILPAMHIFDLEAFVKLTIVCFSCFKLCDSKVALNTMIKAYVFGAAYIGYYILEVGRSANGRAEGVGMIDSPDVNDAAAALVPAGIFCLHLFWAAQSFKHRVFPTLCGALIVNCLVLMNSRGAFLGLVAGASWYIFFILREKINIKNKKLKVISLILMGLIALSQVVDDQTLDRIATLTNQSASGEKETGATRIHFWLASLDMAKDYPVGAGTRSFLTLSHMYIPTDIDTGRTRNRAVHSSWFQVLSEVGYLGFFLFVGMLFSAYRMYKRAIKKLQENEKLEELYILLSIFSCIFGYMVTATFLDRGRAVVLYLMLTLLACAYNIFYLKNKQV